MARGLSATIQSRLASLSQVRVILVSVATTGSTQYYTNAPFDIVFDSNTYQAQADFLGVTDVEENAELIITNCNLIISGLDTDNITTFAQTGMVGKQVIIRSAYLNPTDNSIIDTPIITFKGKATGYAVADADKTATISLEVASTFANFEKTTGRYTNEGSFQREHPNDRSMQFSHQVIQDIKWGRN